MNLQAPFFSSAALSFSLHPALGILQGFLYLLSCFWPAGGLHVWTAPPTSWMEMRRQPGWPDVLSERWLDAVTGFSIFHSRCIIPA